MPPIKAVKNQYVGINAHLHSYWQAQGGWSEFHTSHINDLFRQLNLQLIPMGYSAGLEKSLQIRQGTIRVGQPESDVIIYDLSGKRGPYMPLEHGGTTELHIAEIPALMEARAEYFALTIRKDDQEGLPIAWIELLSPSNKPGGSHFNQYFDKRLMLIQDGMVFIELDYLNHTRPTLDELRDGLPYRISIIDPHPDYLSGKLFARSFGVDDPIPVLTLPLAGSDRLNFDFGQPYHRTILETFFAYRLVDYNEVPLSMDFYRPEDKKRIFARMNAIAQAVRDGVDLEAHAPLPIEPT
jgi:hypothetical protein